MWAGWAPRARIEEERSMESDEEIIDAGVKSNRSIQLHATERKFGRRFFFHPVFLWMTAQHPGGTRLSSALNHLQVRRENPVFPSTALDPLSGKCGGQFRGIFSGMRLKSGNFFVGTDEMYQMQGRQDA